MTRFLRLALVVIIGYVPLGLQTAAATAEWQPPAPRKAVPLLEDWRTIAGDESAPSPEDFASPAFDDSGWETVRIPHNWDRYEGFRQVKHGVRHGSAWYRKTFTLDAQDRAKSVFLFFEGVGSYASVWVNGQLAGHHEGGLTTFTLDITRDVRWDEPNTLAVRVDHPPHIRDLPWVCGGCELAYGFSEGTQPFGISRPVHIILTDPLRVAPFGVHAWNDETVSGESATIHLTTEVTNHGSERREFSLRQILLDESGIEVARTESAGLARAGATVRIGQSIDDLPAPRLWHPDSPYLYTIVTEILTDGVVVDRMQLEYGIRSIEWPDLAGPTGEPLRINGRPFFLNGVADYEHLLGESHAFTDEQVRARAEKIMAVGFNAFRDAHHPHNLRFNRIWDREGILWWTQMGAHIWFDNPEFRATFKKRLRDWVKERRNSPSLFLYTIQNESKLPAWFAAECREIIRELDPTASRQRLVVTCNGGEGTDWDVPQNWSGTYGGDPFLYGSELIEQRMVGEYGAWRSLGLHSEGGFLEDGPLSEDRMAALLEIKLREAESVRDKVIGHFMWPFTTHQNPGRNVGSEGQQTRDGIRVLDQIGPANNKGLQTIWGEPLDAWYMYRSNYADPETDPMAYIVSHTWPDRWTEPGIKDNLIVYSNADEVELFNGFRTRSLGVRRKDGKGTHFRWDGVDIQTNLLYAEARIDGKTVARDWITLHHLPVDPTLEALDPAPPNVTAPAEGFTYLYRLNAGGPAYTDANGSHWAADRRYVNGAAMGSRSWAEAFPNLDPFFGSKREIFDPVLGTRDDPLFQSYRYGRQDLEFIFDVPDGSYRIELYFIEPVYGTGGEKAENWRLFDVAVNGRTVLQDVDLFAEAGRARAVKKVVEGMADGGRLRIHFPHVAANQAVISAIAVASANAVKTDTASLKETVFGEIKSGHGSLARRTWLDTGIQVYPDANYTLSDLSWELREADWLSIPFAARTATGTLADVALREDANIYVAHDPALSPLPTWLSDWEKTPFFLETTLSGVPFPILRKRMNAGEVLTLGSNSETGSEAVGMYLVLAQKRFPPPPAGSIFAFEVKGSHAAEGWRPVGNLRAGQPLYTDGGPAVSRFSSRLSDCDWIQTARSDADNEHVETAFTVDDHTLVYVGLDKRVSVLPDWMNPTHWVPSRGFTLSTTDSGPDAYFLWQRRYLPGETVRLGPNARLPDGQPARMYTVIVRPVRAAFTLETESQDNTAKLYATGLPGYTGDGYVDLADSGRTSFEFFFEVGVGDRYGLNFRYHSRSNETVTAEVVIRNTADGAIVCTDTYTFPPTGGQTWAVMRERTCESTNAGIYAVEISGPDIDQLAFDSLQVE
jgi:hypothetical protein